MENCNPAFKFRTVDEKYIKRILDSLNPKKSAGIDKISPRATRLSSPVLSCKIMRLINHFSNTQSCPLVWKSSNVTPLHKRADENEKSNYLPLSILLIILKVYEKVLFDQMYTAISPHFSSSLSGFLKGHSCRTALIKITDDWRVGLDDRKGIVTIAIDLSKAFDFISHSLPIAKLKAYGR